MEKSTWAIKIIHFCFIAYFIYTENNVEAETQHYIVPDSYRPTADTKLMPICLTDLRATGVFARLSRLDTVYCL